MLYLAESEYPPDDKRPTLVTGAVVQYLLDNFATVEEAVEAMRLEKFRHDHRKENEKDLCRGDSFPYPRAARIAQYIGPGYAG